MTTGMLLQADLVPIHCENHRVSFCAFFCSENLVQTFPSGLYKEGKHIDEKVPDALLVKVKINVKVKSLCLTKYHAMKACLA
jgi:hypothetical protein